MPLVINVISRKTKYAKLSLGKFKMTTNMFTNEFSISNIIHTISVWSFSTYVEFFETTSSSVIIVSSWDFTILALWMSETITFKTNATRSIFTCTLIF